MKTKNFTNMMALCIITIMCACSHKPTERLVGNDRDKHGCIASAGYVWSEALKDCIRVWEVGVRLDNGGNKVFVVFSNDSSVAEVYTDEGKCIPCRRVNDNLWESEKENVSVSFEKKVMKVHAMNILFSKTVR